MIRSDDRLKFMRAVRAQSHFRFVMHPNTSKPLPLLELSTLNETLQRLPVRTLAGTFPRISWDQHALKLDEHWVEGYYDGRAKSVYRLYRSGQFVHYETLDEDDPDIQAKLKEGLEVSDEEKKQIEFYLNYPWNAARIIECYAFASRLAALLDPVAEWKLELALVNPGVRALSIYDPRRTGFWHLYYVEKDVTHEQVLTRTELAVEPDEACLRALRSFDERFQVEVRDDVLREFINQYRPRTG